MDEVRFEVAVEELGAGPYPTVTPYVNGVKLRDLARPVELGYATAEGKPQLAGRYAGLAATPAVCWPSRHFLGEPQITGFQDGDPVLLGCVCGDAGCWPLTAEVVVLDDTVVWRRFRTGHRTWDLGALGPFRFDRGQYEAALRQTARD